MSASARRGPDGRAVRAAAPFLKWAGGKGQLLDQMAPFFPSGQEFDTYYEPFLGGGAVFFHLAPQRAVLSDTNPELINVWRQVRDAPEAVMEALERHRPNAHVESYFYQIRSQRPERLAPVDRAARMIFLNKTCFNGLYRVNSRGEFNVPFGRYDGPSLYDHENLLLASRALEGAALIEEDYREICRTARKGDFVYLDPPYHPLSDTSAFTAYTREGFGDREQEQLAETFRALDNRGVKVMLSNSPTPKVRGLYDEFKGTTQTLRAKRAINSKGTGRGAIPELLVMNYGQDR